MCQSGHAWSYCPTSNIARSNGPSRSNVKRLRGIDARTGDGNFDISEAIWLKLIRELDAPTPSIRLSTSESQPSVAANRQMEPQKLGRLVKGELDWIVMKALSKERDRRYETATGIARDVERFLNNEAVAAGLAVLAVVVQAVSAARRPAGGVRASGEESAVSAKR